MMQRAVLLSLLIFLVVTGITWAQVDDSLVLFLSFDEGSGNVSVDRSLSNLVAVIGGAKWTDGKFGKALEFDGVDDFVSVQDAPEVLLLDGGTIMAWVYIQQDAGHVSWPRICLKSNTNGGTGPGYDFLFDRANGYALRFCGGGACNTYGDPVETDAWHHVAVTFDGSDVRVFVDGVNTGEGPQAGAIIDSTGMEMQIGNSAVDARQFNGIMDEFRMWSRALDVNEIQAQMERSADDIFAVDPQGKLATCWAHVKS